MSDPKTVIAARAAQELRPGEIVNLGIGIPNLIPGHLGAETEIFLHTENGLLGVGPRPPEEEVDPDLVDAAKRPITAFITRPRSLALVAPVPAMASSTASST